MSNFRIQTVYRGGLQTCSLVEYNVVEGVQNNIFGTLNCAQAAIGISVETFI